MTFCKIDLQLVYIYISNESFVSFFKVIWVCFLLVVATKRLRTLKVQYFIIERKESNKIYQAKIMNTA